MTCGPAAFGVCAVVTLAACLETPAFAGSAPETAADKISRASRTIPFEEIPSSPDSAITREVERIAGSKNERVDRFVSPEMMTRVGRYKSLEEALMNPDVLRALSRMSRDEAARALKEMRDPSVGAGNGLPGLSDPEGDMNVPDEEPESLSLSGWRLVRANGEVAVEREHMKSSRLIVKPGMVMGGMGRVERVIDTSETFELRFENGSRIFGRPDPEKAEKPEAVQKGIPAPRMTIEPDPDAISTQAPRTSLRPVARPSRDDRDFPDKTGADNFSQGEDNSPVTSLRPVARPSREKQE